MEYFTKKSLAPEWVKPSKAKEDGPEPPRFQIKSLSNIDMLELDDMIRISAFQQKGIPEHALRFTKDINIFLLKRGWIGWENVPEWLEWSDDIMVNIEILNPEDMQWLAAEIHYKSTVTEDDKKKSS